MLPVPRFVWDEYKHPEATISFQESNDPSCSTLILDEYFLPTPASEQPAKIMRINIFINTIKSDIFRMRCWLLWDLSNVLSTIMLMQDKCVLIILPWSAKHVWNLMLVAERVMFSKPRPHIKTLYWYNVLMWYDVIIYIYIYTYIPELYKSPVFVDTLLPQHPLLQWLHHKASQLWTLQMQNPHDQENLWD